MPKRLKPLFRLTEEQANASKPDALAFVSASAGTGKTQVLTARVMRLLLAGVDPASILCLTFTKAGAAEMADRIHARLAYWVRLKEADLSGELQALGENFGPDERAAARRLFARVLDATGGGLRIQTIHAFAQSLLAAFPAEAGIVPGFRPIEPREEAVLARETLAAMVVAAEERGDRRIIADIQALSRRMSEVPAERFLMTCAHRVEALHALGPEETIGDRLREALDLPAGDTEAAIAKVCETGFDTAALRRIATANAAWGTATGLGAAKTIERWLDTGSDERARALEALREVWSTKKGDMRSFSSRLLNAEASYPELAAELDDVVRALIETRELARFAEFAASALRAGQRFAFDYALAKRRAGLVDFDDLILRAVALLKTPGMGDWVRYKLDQSIDHILVDEAQDTNGAQWDIVKALAGEFLETAPGEARKLRTIFAVGDFKQAIFGFQGTNPQEFLAARKEFTDYAASRQRDLLDLGLDLSYRSSPPILDFVDEVIGELGHDAIGLDRPANLHRSSRAEYPGSVTLWAPTIVETRDAAEEEGEEGWVDDATRVHATRIARQIRSWIDEELWLSSEGRAMRPEDVLVLVRARKGLASLIVARLHEEGVPVAGVDRLSLTAPLAIRDLLSALRFALQPHDDLNLAGLLVSPLLGWSQDELYDLAKGERSSLWRSLQREDEKSRNTRAALTDILNLADLVTPYRLLETILSGALDGRRKLLKRLGEEARDPIEELLAAALAFEGEGTPTLQRFLDWFDRGDVEITRDPSAPLDAVRVMTVHGAKGLEAPVVILADATADPERSPRGAIKLSIVADAPPAPLPRPRKAEQLGPLAGEVEQLLKADREEHWRLLYVALTRAKERLVIGGALGSSAKGEAPKESWHAIAARAMARLGIEAKEDALFGTAYRFEGREPATLKQRQIVKMRSPLPIHREPPWLREPAPPEARPPRPLAPSSLGPDDVADPPPSDALERAARRGRWLHALFERLPALAPEEREAAALAWLERSAGLADEAERRELVASACAIIADTTHAEIFGPNALAEAPLAAVVRGTVVAGTVDRLLIAEDRVRVVDFKTGRRVPSGPEAVPETHLRQMAAYTAALGQVFPGRKIEAALLYTAGPRLIALSGAMLAEHAPATTPAAG